MGAGICHQRHWSTHNRRPDGNNEDRGCRVSRLKRRARNAQAINAGENRMGAPGREKGAAPLN